MVGQCVYTGHPSVTKIYQLVNKYFDMSTFLLRTHLLLYTTLFLLNKINDIAVT